MSNNKQIVQDTITQGRLYPRPQDKCNQCDQSVILCWGEKIIPYWRHVAQTNSTRNHKPDGESLCHKHAKEKLITFLTQKKTVLFSHKCNQKITQIPPNAVTFKPEVKYKNCVFDIGCLDSDNKLLFGIEIYHTHKTSNVKFRNEIGWCEVKADQVLNLLDSNIMPKELLLVDHSNQPCCVEDFKSCSLVDLSKKLGYYNERTDINVLKIISIVTRGYYKVSKCWDFSRNKNYRYNRALWDEFISRGKCMYCKKDCNTSMYRPLCRNCWKKEKGGKFEDKEEILFVDKNTISNLKRQLSWINGINGSGNHFTLCDFCQGATSGVNNDTYKDYYNGGNYVPQYLLWFDDKKRICTVCLDEQFKERGIIYTGNVKNHNMKCNSNNKTHKIASDDYFPDQSTNHHKIFSNDYFTNQYVNVGKIIDNGSVFDDSD